MTSPLSSIVYIFDRELRSKVLISSPIAYILKLIITEKLENIGKAIDWIFKSGIWIYNVSQGLNAAQL